MLRKRNKNKGIKTTRNFKTEGKWRTERTRTKQNDIKQGQLNRKKRKVKKIIKEKEAKREKKTVCSSGFCTFDLLHLPRHINPICISSTFYFLPPFTNTGLSCSSDFLHFFLPFSRSVNVSRAVSLHEWTHFLALFLFFLAEYSIIIHTYKHVIPLSFHFQSFTVLPLHKHTSHFIWFFLHLFFLPLFWQQQTLSSDLLIVSLSILFLL